MEDDQLDLSYYEKQEQIAAYHTEEKNDDYQFVTRLKENNMKLGRCLHIHIKTTKVVTKR